MKPDKPEAAKIPDDFTLKLALVDSVPVLEFGAGMLIIASKFKSVLFAAGAFCSTLAGCGKVLWKIILAVKKRNVLWLNQQFRYLMSSGFVLMLLSLLANRKRIHPGRILKRILCFPAAVFFGLSACGMCALGIMGMKLDKNRTRDNWIEQITNLISQGLLLIGICVS